MIKDFNCYENILMEAESSRDEESVKLNILVNEDAFEIRHSTNIDYDPVFRVLEKDYPPKESDVIYLKNSEESGFIEPPLPEEEYLQRFEFSRYSSPKFEVKWENNSEELDNSHIAPFDFALTSYDLQDMSLDSIGAEPIEEFMPVMLRFDTSHDVKKELIEGLLSIIDYGGEREQVSLENYLNDKNMDIIFEKAVGEYDPDR